MPAIPRYLVGKNVSLVAVAAAYIDQYANIGIANDYRDLHTSGVFDTFEMTLDFGTQDIHATDATITNYVQTVADFEFRVGEIQGPGGYAKIIDIGSSQSIYFAAECNTYDPVSGESFSTFAFGIYQSLQYGVVEGKNVAMAVFKPCGIYPAITAIKGVGAGPNPFLTGGVATGNVRQPHVVTNQHP